MSDCIKREDAIREIQKFGVGAQDFESYTPEQAERFVIGRLESIPAADVAPVVHGKWIWDKDGMDWGIGAWRCSICYARPETWWQGDKSNTLNKSGHCYCPNCGAKMDKDNNGKSES